MMFENEEKVIANRIPLMNKDCYGYCFVRVEICCSTCVKATPHGGKYGYK